MFVRSRSSRGRAWTAHRLEEARGEAVERGVRKRHRRLPGTAGAWLLPCRHVCAGTGRRGALSKSCARVLGARMECQRLGPQLRRIRMSACGMGVRGRVRSVAWGEPGLGSGAAGVGGAESKELATKVVGEGLNKAPGVTKGGALKPHRVAKGIQCASVQREQRALLSDG